MIKLTNTPLFSSPPLTTMWASSSCSWACKFSNLRLEERSWLSTWARESSRRFLGAKNMAKADMRHIVMSKVKELWAYTGKWDLLRIFIASAMQPYQSLYPCCSRNTEGRAQKSFRRSIDRKCSLWLKGSGWFPVWKHFCLWEGQNDRQAAFIHLSTTNIHSKQHLEVKILDRRMLQMHNEPSKKTLNHWEYLPESVRVHVFVCADCAC